MSTALSMVAAGGTAMNPKGRGCRVVDGCLVESLTAAVGGITRRLAIVGYGSWVRVVTRLEPASVGCLIRR